MNNQQPIKPKGQAALLSVLFIFILGFLTVDGVSTVTIGNRRTTNDILASTQAYYTAEGLIEDAVLRIKDSELLDPDNDTYSYGGASVTTTVTTDPETGAKTVRVTSDVSNRKRILEADIIEDIATVSFENGLQAGAGGIDINNSAIVNGNVCSEGDFIGAATSVTGNVNVVNGLTQVDEQPASFNITSATTKFSNVTSARDAGQMFTTDVSGNNNLTRIKVYLKKIGNPGDLTLLILPNKVSGGQNYPDNRAAALTSQTITQEAITSNTAGSWVVVTLDDPISLAYNTKYWVVLDGRATASSSNYWEWFTQTGGSGDGLVMSNWSHNTSPGWDRTAVTEDFIYSIFLSPNGEEGFKVQSINATGTINANLIINSSSGLGACPNGDCADAVLDNCPGDTLSLNPESQEITNWKQDAYPGNPCNECDENGDIRLNTGDDPVTIGNVTVPGDVVLNGTSTIKISGTVWIQGSLSVGNSGRVELTPEKQADGYGVIIVGNNEGTTGDITVSNSAFFDAGDSGNILVLSLRRDPEHNNVIIENTGGGDVFFVAPETCIRSSNNTNSKALIGYCLVIQNSSEINYESALGDFIAQTPFTDIVWKIGSWKEVE